MAISFVGVDFEMFFILKTIARQGRLWYHPSVEIEETCPCNAQMGIARDRENFNLILTSLPLKLLF